MDKFEEWVSKCPVEYDEIHETSDKNIVTINFHGKDIYWHAIGKEIPQKDWVKGYNKWKKRQ